MLKRRTAFGAALVILAAAALTYQSFVWANTYYVGRAEEAGQATLSLVTEAVDQAVGRYRPIPSLIAREPTLRQLLTEGGGHWIDPSHSEDLGRIARSIGASEVYVMDRTGTTVAASNYRDADSFVGRNFAYRPYFSQSVLGKSVVFHALGTTSHERGFFFSAPVLDGIDVIGVMAIKIAASPIEGLWSGLDHEILIVDDNQIVFLSSQEKYIFRALSPLSSTTRELIVETKQYPLDAVTPLNLSVDAVASSPVYVTLQEASDDQRYLMISGALDLAGWRAIVLAPLQPAKRQAYGTVGLGLFAITAMTLAILLFVQRRSNILERIHFEQEQRESLEQTVQDRTDDLNNANACLRAEVAERRNAEERLRKSQKELVQAGKMAALGQMSAAISHEINQPLAAIRGYADNAIEFLSRSRMEDVRNNIDRISKMSDRMAQISHHLRTFARQPGDTLQPIHIYDVISETIDLVGPQLRAKGASVYFDPSPTEIWAVGGRLRLQQVLVNIINNALEAMTGQTDQVIEISATQDTERVAITLRDNGPGLSLDSKDQVFDAFYTTKEAGIGMGLGMSISHNIISDFGGALTAYNHEEGGAVFTVTMLAAEKGSAIQ